MLASMVRDDMRAGDSDRQAAAERLRAAVDEGRLDLHEYDERLQRAYAAKTYGELNGLLADLPSPLAEQRSQVVPATPQQPATQPATTPAPAAQPDVTRRWLRDTWSSYGTVVAITIMVWVLSGIGPGDFQGFWPIWVAGPWGLLLVWRTVTGLANGEPQRWAEKQERSQAARQLKKDRAAGRRSELAQDAGGSAPV